MALPKIVSVDDHVVEPPDLWQRWLPAKHRDAGPRVVRAPYRSSPGEAEPYHVAADGPETDFWFYDGVHTPITTGYVAVGRDPEDLDGSPVPFDEMRPGCFDPVERLRDMDLNHVERSLCFPTFARFCGQRFLRGDRELAAACVTAYNDWMVEDWCGPSAGRLLPLCLVPLWDPVAAAAEVRRNAARGVRAVAFSELPTHLGLASLHDPDGFWDPFFAACDDTGTVVCMHIGSSSQMVGPAPDSPFAVHVALSTLNSQVSLAEWLLSGVLARFENLKIAFSEGQVGWMPYLLERVDSVWRRPNVSRSVHPAITRPPSTYMAGRVYGCFFEDDFGVRSRDVIGVDQITFETDYPHADSTWPNSRAYAERALAGLPAHEVHAIVRGNALAMLGLDDCELADTRGDR